MRIEVGDCMRNLALGLLASLALLTSDAHALQQPNGAPIPSQMGCDGGSPTGLPAVFACECTTPGTCNIGAPCPSESGCPDGVNGVCETTLWHEFNDNTCIPSNLAGLDPAAEASVTPQTFQPTCPLTFRVVSRGTAIFGDVFGWYNATGSKPTIDELYVMLDCSADAGTEVVLDLQADPRYLGGEVGFFIATPEQDSACDGGDCCASLERLAAGTGYAYYSERDYNPDASGADSFIHLLIYDSAVTERKFYFAWEDIYGGSNNDFTDLVTSVEGVECSGGGVSCDTGQPGICAHGVSRCTSNQIECHPLYGEEVEQCDALDNDCDGVVDDDATCPEPDHICYNGQCVPHCEIVHEFDCPSSTVCDPGSGRCFDPDCVDIDCPSDKVCRAGECVTPCDAVSCPVGQTCRFGDCVDPCRHVVCGDGEACREGICFPGCTSCAGVQCTGGLTCAADSGDCYDPSCPDGCPKGTYCDEGACLDACEGAVCPTGLSCSEGDCTDGTGGNPDGGPSGDDDDDGGGTDGGGCGCARATSSGMPAEAILILFALLPWRRKLR